MNQAQLLDQFIVEARECLETIGQRLLEVERSPADAALLNDLFRCVHTLKGNCGLFEFKPLERVVHAGEDLLDCVRNGELSYTDSIADALLDAMDYSAELIDQIQRQGCIDSQAEARSMKLAKALRELLESALEENACNLPDCGESAGAALGDDAGSTVPPAWLARLGDVSAYAGATALRYTPEPECFFKGEDPWRLACTVPSLRTLDVAPLSGSWPQGDARADWDCYRCDLDIVLISDAPRAYIEEHFRCVPEQVQWHELPRPAAVPVAADRGNQVMLARAAQLWEAQCAVLARPGITTGTQHAVARVIAALITSARPDPAVANGPWPACVPLDGMPTDARLLLAWCQSHGQRHANEGQDGNGKPTADDPSTPPDTAMIQGQPGGPAPSRVLKVGQEKIDRLMDLIGEMVVAKNSLPYLAERAESVFSQRELAREIKAQYAVINRIAEDMQNAIMQVRMLPVGTIFQRFGRLVRDISKKLSKDVQLVIEGEETEADKNVIESLADPLIHILRNSLDHGIELPERRLQAGKPAHGTIRIQARQQSDRVLIDISDDGAGVDPQRVRDKAVERGLIPADRAHTLSDDESVQLIFLAGFSTAESISDLSGRGVGMDVVRTAVERIGGAVSLSSRLGQGTTIGLSMPLSMAVTNVMMIQSGGLRFGVPMDLIVETVRVHADDIHHFKQARTTVLRGRIVPLRSLGELLETGQPDERNEEGEHAVLVVRLGQENVGLIVDRFHGASDIILKPLEGVLAGLTGFAGTALMGDGSVLMVLNPKELI